MKSIVYTEISQNIEELCNKIMSAGSDCDSPQKVTFSVLIKVLEWIQVAGWNFKLL